MLYGKISFGEVRNSTQDLKAKDICVYTGDFNGDGITDYAYIRCMTPYNQSPKLNVCFNHRDGLEMNSCVTMAVDLE